MSRLRQAAEDYVSIRRVLGFKLDRHPRLLAQFVAYLEEAGASTVTTGLALAWATIPAGTSPDWHRARLSVARGFAAYLAALDPGTQVPAADLLSRGDQRATPYLLSEDALASLVAAAGALAPPLRAATYGTLFGLLAVAGLRVGEAIRLGRDDVDPAAGLLLVRNSKWDKSRELPLDPSTIGALSDYARTRDRLCPAPRQPSFFVSTRGTRLVYSDIRRTLLGLARRAGITAGPAGSRLRPHALRHSFAVATLLDWYRAGADVDAQLPALSAYMGHAGPSSTYWYLSAAPELLAVAAGARPDPGRAAMSALAPTLQAFFTQRLISQRQASPHTVAAYRDALRMLIVFTSARCGRQPHQLDFEDLDAPCIGAFLEHLERDRGASARTRNARLTAIRALFRFAALRHPEHAELIARVLAIPAKRFDRALVSFLTLEEIEALLASPDRSSWTGRRDHAPLLTGVCTGLRVSELTALTCQDVHLGTGPHLRCHGKGRKERVTPLTPQAVSVLRAWMTERAAGPAGPLFPTRRGSRLSRDAVQRRLDKYASLAARRCPSLRPKRLTPHVLRHSCAMQLREAGTDLSVIALWLGHQQLGTAQIYLHADLTIKQRALARTTPPRVAPGRYRPPDPLLSFLEDL